MNYNDLQNELKKRGVDISVITLRRYVKAGLIPEPKRDHLGRGKGQHVDFPPEAIAEAGAARMVFRLNRNPSVEIVKQARDLALEALAQNSIAALQAHEQNIFPGDYEARVLAFEWLKYYILIKLGYSLNVSGYWEITSRGIRFICDPTNKDDMRVKQAIKYALEAQKRKDK